MEAREHLTVSQLNQFVKSLLDEVPILQDIWVEGEISNFKLQNSGHLYFSLKDAQSSIRCVMFSSRARLLRFRPDNAMKVLLRGSVSLYERDGQYQLYATQMEPLCMGSLALALEQRKQRLTAEGLFDANRKKPLPFLPKRVGVVTSPTGAAFRDVVNVITRRCPGVNILLAPVLVQGPGAAEQIAAAIQLFNHRQLADVLIVGRGGGSLEELWAFNEEVVARAIAASQIPIVSAVGHETDFTLADFAADLRAPTPSAAAELVVPELAGLRDEVADFNRRLQSAVNSIFRQKQEKLLFYQNKLEPELFLGWLRRKQDALRGPSQRLQHAMLVFLAQKNSRFALLNGKLDALSPLRILSRGYTMCQHEGSRTVISSLTQIVLGDEIRIHFSDGSAVARILEMDEPLTGGSKHDKEKGTADF
ncbi:MAG: exodeoxyribonuclease VII large subunit [Negativicutes bacterium]|nr:exodeoxyribonuclease VII large subunit [Negativicutes bacterium]